ncbi:MAG: hypothetical protein NC389_09710 [Acetatifactor muris]|nr:hypothetical protein [Acetatifactor muris]
MEKDNFVLLKRDWSDTSNQCTAGKKTEAIRKAIEEYGIPVKCVALAVSSSNNLLRDI